MVSDKTKEEIIRASDQLLELGVIRGDGKDVHLTKGFLTLLRVELGKRKDPYSKKSLTQASLLTCTMLAGPEGIDEKELLTKTSGS